MNQPLSSPPRLSERSDGIGVPANARLQQLSATLHGFGGSPIRLEGLSAHRMNQVDSIPGILLGYGGLHEARIRDGVRALATIAAHAKR
jgi:hypothetical protein